MWLRETATTIFTPSAAHEKEKMTSTTWYEKVIDMYFYRFLYRLSYILETPICYLEKGTPYPTALLFREGIINLIFLKQVTTRNMTLLKISP